MKYLLPIAALLSLLSLCSPVPAADPLPNILWFTTEDMSAVLGCWGDEYADTPHLDAFAKESVRYTRAFATNPVCSPSRSCLITGVYSTSLGTQRLRSEFPIPKDVHGFPSYLRKLGYHTSNNVKTDYNTSEESRLIQESWNENSAKAHWRSKKDGQPFFSVFNDMTTHQSRAMVWTPEHFRKDVQSRLGQSRHHDPQLAPVPPYYPDTQIVRETIARFYDCVTVMDDNFGKILQQLEDDGFADDTIVFFYSDHGSGLPRHKRLLLDSGMHVPLMVRFPKKYRHWAPAEPGATIGRLVSFVDFAPTVLSLAGIEPPSKMQGTAFLGAHSGPERRFVFGARDRVDEVFDVARSVRDERYLYVRNYHPHLSYNQPSAYSDLGEIRDEINAFSRSGKLSGAQAAYAGPTRNVEELYDTQQDPHNLVNLADSVEHRDVLMQMRTQQRQWSARTLDLGWLPESEIAKSSQGTTPYEWIREQSGDLLERVRQIADLVGEVDAEANQLRGVKDPNPSVRYWAALGLHASGRGTEALRDALGDPSEAVRIEAASALLDRGIVSPALEVLRSGLQSSDQNVVLRAARAAQLSGDLAKPLTDVIKAAQKKAAASGSPIGLFIDFATTMHLVDLGEINEKDAFASYR